MATKCQGFYMHYVYNKKMIVLSDMGHNLIHLELFLFLKLESIHSSF